MNHEVFCLECPLCKNDGHLFKLEFRYVEYKFLLICDRCGRAFICWFDGRFWMNAQMSKRELFEQLGESRTQKQFMMNRRGEYL